MPCHAMPCHVMFSHATQGHPMPSHAIPCFPKPSNAIPCHPISSHSIQTHPMPFHAITISLYLTVGVAPGILLSSQSRAVGSHLGRPGLQLQGVFSHPVVWKIEAYKFSV